MPYHNFLLSSSEGTCQERSVFSLTYPINPVAFDCAQPTEPSYECAPVLGNWFPVPATSAGETNEIKVGRC